MTGGTAATLQGVFVTQFFKYFVYGDSAWRYVGYDLARAGRDGAKVGAVVSATNPDLSAFRAHGGKLLLVHGWSDPALNARSTIEYFKAVQARTPQASSFTRLFLMPGVLHCGGGSGCDDVDWAVHHPRLGGAGRGTIAHRRAQARRHAGGANASAVCVPDDGAIQRYRQHRRCCGVYLSIARGRPSV